MQSKKLKSLPVIIAGIFLFSLVYWLYLSVTTTMDIANDSIGYESLGRMIYTHGWIDYFRTGPNREPLYPSLVAASMALEHITGLSYLRIMAFIGVVILCATQILIYLLLKKLRVSTPVSAWTLTYFAISPAINNAAFSLYSEIAAFPLMFLLIMANMNAYQSIQSGTKKDALCSGICLGLIFCAITFVKGVFEFIFLVFALVYLLAMIMSFFQNKKNATINCLLVFLAFSICYQIPVMAYKSLNKEYNDHYALTNRGSWALYSSCARRAEQLTPERLWTALAYIPGKGFCEGTFGPQKCYFWGIESLDSFGITKYQEVAAFTPASMVDQKMMALSKEKVMHNPGQFLFLMSLDAIKMFFWESTKIGFVEYPSWLQRLYDSHLLKNGLRTVISILSLMGFIFLLVISFKKIVPFFKFNPTADTKDIDSVLILILLSSFIGFYALFDTIPRFALPIASLELVTIALWTDATFFRKEK